jgi:hypothetical protein
MRHFNCFLAVTAILIATATLRPSFFVIANADEGTATASPRNESLVGTWRMATSAIASSNAGAAAGINTRMKIYNDTHWVLVQPDPDSGKVVFVHGGTYDFDGTFLEEKVEFAGEDTVDLIGTSFKFRIVFGEGTYEQVDPNGVFSETWKRTKQRNSDKATHQAAKTSGVNSKP